MSSRPIISVHQVIRYKKPMLSDPRLGYPSRRPERCLEPRRLNLSSCPVSFPWGSSGCQGMVIQSECCTCGKEMICVVLHIAGQMKKKKKKKGKEIWRQNANLGAS